MASMPFDSIETQRAWSLAVEHIYNYAIRLDSSPLGLAKIANDAQIGHPVAGVIYAHYLSLRLKGNLP
jgi:hypothetical protein